MASISRYNRAILIPSYSKSASRYSKGSSAKKVIVVSQNRRRKNRRFNTKDARRNIVRVTRGPTPTQAFAKLKVSGIITVTIGTAGQYNATDLVAIMNDLTAPSNFFTQQPTGFDQWARMFQRYTVIASACKLHISNVTDSLAQPSLITITLIPTSMTLTQLRAAADAGGTTGTGQQCDLQNDALAKVVMLGNPNADSNALLKHYCKISRLYPNVNIREEANFSGTTSSFSSGEAAPGTTPLWGLCVQSSRSSNGDPAGNTYIVQIQATVTYYTLFSSPVNVYDA